MGRALTSGEVFRPPGSGDGPIARIADERRRSSLRRPPDRFRHRRPSAPAASRFSRTRRGEAVTRIRRFALVCALAAAGVTATSAVAFEARAGIAFVAVTDLPRAPSCPRGRERQRGGARHRRPLREPRLPGARTGRHTSSASRAGRRPPS
jgi:hypothetical protein